MFFQRLGHALAGIIVATFLSVALARSIEAAGLNVEPTVLTAPQIKRIVTGVTLAGTAAEAAIQIFFDPDQTFTLMVKKDGSLVRKLSGNWYVEPEADHLCMSIASGDGGRQCWIVRRSDTIELISARGSLAPLEMPLTAVNFTAADAGQKNLSVEQHLPAGKPSAAGVARDTQAEKLRSRIATLMSRAATQITADLPCSEVTFVVDDGLNVEVRGSVRGQDDIARAEEIIHSSAAAAFISDLAGLTINGGVGGRCATALNGDWSVRLDAKGDPKRELKRNVLKLAEQSYLPDAADCKDIGMAISGAPQFASVRTEGGDISFWVRGKLGLQPCLGSGSRWSLGPSSADDLDGFVVLRKN